jgi:hypothetical protein
MEPKTCPHPTCGHEWTPRKANPKKCPQCQNPLWRSPRPKKQRHDEYQEPTSEQKQQFIGKVMEYAEGITFEPVPEPECVRAPEEEKDSLSLLKAKADELLRKLVTA